MLRLLLAFTLCILIAGDSLAAMPADAYWQVKDVRIGMKGLGKTVMKGTKVETFEVEVLGVLTNTSPGRDLVLVRLSGLGLEKTGVIAGMSGSPVYIEGKLLGAVAYTWASGTEPIGGITPFSQMHQYVEEYERRDAGRNKPTRVGLAKPLLLDGQEYRTATVAQDFDHPSPRSVDGLFLTPLRTPLIANGFSERSLAVLQEQCRMFGLAPMQGGGTTAEIAEQEKNTPLEPGGPLTIAMIRGDFDLSGIGTVTHIQDKRVYGWGHPFMSIGECDLPLMTGYIHVVYPRSTVSFKMGSPLRTVGIINADVSTCVAGWLDREPDMLPMRMQVQREGGPENTFDVEIIRHPSLTPNLVLTALTNSIDMEGDLPSEVTARLKVSMILEDCQPIVIEDVYSGFNGRQTGQYIYSQVASMVRTLLNNPHKIARIKRIDCVTHLESGRTSAEIESVEADAMAYEPGDEVRVTAYLRPYQRPIERVVASLQLPSDLPEGSYRLTICDDAANAREEIRGDPRLSNPLNIDQVIDSLRVQASVNRKNLVLRMPVGQSGVAKHGNVLPSLPGSMIRIMKSSRRSGGETIEKAIVARKAVDWIVQGSESIMIKVERNK